MLWIIFLFIIITAITFVGIYRCHFLLKYTIMVVKQPGKNMHSSPYIRERDLKTLKVDGYQHTPTKTYNEFQGCYFRGCPCVTIWINLFLINPLNITRTVKRSCYLQTHFDSWSKIGFIDSVLHEWFCQPLMAMTDYAVIIGINFVGIVELAKDPVTSRK